MRTLTLVCWLSCFPVWAEDPPATAAPPTRSSGRVALRYGIEVEMAPATFARMTRFYDFSAAPPGYLEKMPAEIAVGFDDYLDDPKAWDTLPEALQRRLLGGETRLKPKIAPTDLFRGEEEKSAPAQVSPRLVLPSDPQGLRSPQDPQAWENMLAQLNRSLHLPPLPAGGGMAARATGERVGILGADGNRFTTEVAVSAPPPMKLPENAGAQAQSAAVKEAWIKLPLSEKIAVIQPDYLPPLTKAQIFIHALAAKLWIPLVRQGLAPKTGRLLRKLHIHNDIGVAEFTYGGKASVGRQEFVRDMRALTALAGVESYLDRPLEKPSEAFSWHNNFSRVDEKDFFATADEINHLYLTRAAVKGRVEELKNRNDLNGFEDVSDRGIVRYQDRRVETREHFLPFEEELKEIESILSISDSAQARKKAQEITVSLWDEKVVKQLAEHAPEAFATMVVRANDGGVLEPTHLPLVKQALQAALRTENAQEVVTTLKKEISRYPRNNHDLMPTIQRDLVFDPPTAARWVKGGVDRTFRALITLGVPTERWGPVIKEVLKRYPEAFEQYVGGDPVPLRVLFRMAPDDAEVKQYLKRFFDPNRKFGSWLYHRLAAVVDSSSENRAMAAPWALEWMENIGQDELSPAQRELLVAALRSESSGVDPCGLSDLEL